MTVLPTVGIAGVPPSTAAETPSFSGVAVIWTSSENSWSGDVTKGTSQSDLLQPRLSSYSAHTASDGQNKWQGHPWGGTVSAGTCPLLALVTITVLLCCLTDSALGLGPLSHSPHLRLASSLSQQGRQAAGTALSMVARAVHTQRWEEEPASWRKGQQA